MVLTIARVTSFGAAAPGDEHRADDQVGIAHQLFDRMRGRVHGLQLAAEDRRQFAQPLDRAIDHGDIGAQPDRHLRRVSAGDAAAQDHDLRRRHAGHAAEQHAEAAVGLLQAVGAHLHGHAARDLAHRREQRQRAVRRGDGLVGDRGGARGHQRLRLFAVGGQDAGR